MNENKKFESERYLYREADVYTPHTIKKPKLHEMGYFTDNMETFNDQKVRKYTYVYGELIDYNADCEGHFYYDSYLLSVDNDDYYEGRYRCGCEWEDNWGDRDYIEENYAFYIPESSIPKEKQKWYRKHRYNTPTYKGYFGPMEDLEKAFFSTWEDLEVEEYLYVHGDEEQ